MSIIKVEYEMYSTTWRIHNALVELQSLPVLSFDTETRGVYTAEEREEAKQYLKEENISVSDRALALQVAENSGLSFPTLIRVTHFIFGVSESKSIVLVCAQPSMEKLIWQWIASYNGKLLVHNTSYDLKIMYSRIGKMPKDYEDTALLAKCLINDAEVWKAKVGLKDLMGSYYDPAWSLMDDYEPDDLKKGSFLMYAAIDGAATFKLWYDMQSWMGVEDENK